MYAAVVHAFGTPPRYEEYPTPVPHSEHEVLVDVLAAGLHHVVRGQATGRHYSSDGTLPLVPGIDAVGRTAEGELLYFAIGDGAPGTFAQQAVVDRRRCLPLPAGTDPVAVAAGMNTGMSSWIALTLRATVPPGGSVLVLGATGNSGRLAVQIAKRRGASRVIGAGRDPERLTRLSRLGADATVTLDPGEIAAAAADVDVVLDYVWGQPTEQTMVALLTARADRTKRLAWVQIGSVAGPDLTLPAHVLRAANLTILGSGLGSVGAAGIIAVLPELAAAIADGTLAVDPVTVPLATIEDAWNAPSTPDQRLVVIP